MNIVVAALHIYVDGSCEENRNVLLIPPPAGDFVSWKAIQVSEEVGVKS